MKCKDCQHNETISPHNQWCAVCDRADEATTALIRALANQLAAARRGYGWTETVTTTETLPAPFIRVGKLRIKVAAIYCYEARGLEVRIWSDGDPAYNAVDCADEAARDAALADLDRACGIQPANEGTAP